MAEPRFDAAAAGRRTGGPSGPRTGKRAAGATAQGGGDPVLRLASWNVEWFDALFDDEGRPLADDEWSARHEVTRREQLDAVARVLAALDADGVMIIEAPDISRRRNGVRALERFAAQAGLRTRRAVAGFANGTRQEIIFLHDPDRLEAHHDPRDDGPEAPRFDGRLRLELGEGNGAETVRFSKPPLELALRDLASGVELRAIGVHLKSKAPHGADDAGEARRIGLRNRRRQLGQAVWLRRRAVCEIARGAHLVVMGDFNDGPGVDHLEEALGISSVEVVLGSAAIGQVAGAPLADGPRLREPHAEAAIARRFGVRPTTARFWLADAGRYGQALLDYIMVSPEMIRAQPRWRIWHPFDDPECWARPALRDGLISASDHFPVSLCFAPALLANGARGPI